MNGCVYVFNVPLATLRPLYHSFAKHVATPSTRANCCVRLTFLAASLKVDPVRIESLEKFGTPEEVGERVLKVEQGKDGTLDTKMFGARAEKQGDLSLYTLVRKIRGTVCNLRYIWKTIAVSTVSQDIENPLCSERCNS